MSQGRAVGLRERQLIVQLKEHFDQERFQGPFVSTEDPAGRVAKALGIGKRVVKEIVSHYHQTGKIEPPELELRGKPPYRIQPALETVIRHEIRRRNREGSHISLANLCSWLENHYEKVSKATLGRALARMGFMFGKSRRTSALRERDDVLIARRSYLRAKLANRDTGGGTLRPEVYLDESYVNVNHSSERTWYFAEEGPWVKKPSGKGPRLILVHAMTAAGWVSGAKLVFQAKKRTGDYHGQMNFDNFHKWFVESLLPQIPAHSLIVMDNAPYHNVYAEGTFYPTNSTTKAELIDWLQQHDPGKYEESMLKPELLQLCRALCPKPKYELDRIAEAAGHQILRTPQYHPELQPIETCWGVVKNHCATQCDFSMKGLREHLEEGFEKVTPATCQAAVEDMRQEEDRYWREDLENEANE